MKHSSFQTMTEAEGTQTPEKRSLGDFIGSDRISFVMFLLRLFTLYVGLMAMINPYRYSQSSIQQSLYLILFSQHFSKGLMASAAVNALRLHQRIPTITLSAQTLQNILAEDSGHYLAFSLMFMSARQRYSHDTSSGRSQLFVHFLHLLQSHSVQCVDGVDAAHCLCSDACLFVPFEVV